MIAHAGWANSSSDRRPGSTGAFLAATSEGGAYRSREARPWRFAAGGAGAEAGWARVAAWAGAEAGWAAGATEAVAGSSAGGTVAGRARLRLLVTSRENPAPAVNSQSTSTTMAILTPFRRPNVPERPAGAARELIRAIRTARTGLSIIVRGCCPQVRQQPRTITRHRARWRLRDAR